MRFAPPVGVGVLQFGCLQVLLLCWNNKKKTNPPTIKQALFSTSPRQQTSGHKKDKGESREGTLGDNMSDLEMKNGEIFKCHNCKPEDGLLSGRNVALECTGVYPNLRPAIITFFPREMEPAGLERWQTFYGF